MRNSRMNGLFHTNRSTPYARRCRKKPVRTQNIRNDAEINETPVDSQPLTPQRQEPTPEPFLPHQDTCSSVSSVQDTESDDDIAEQMIFTIPETHSDLHDEPNININNDRSSDTHSETSDTPSDASFEAFLDWDEEEHLQFDEEELLHPHLKITKCEVMIMLMNIFMRHNLTNAALEDLLKMINIIVGRASVPCTFYSFSKFFVEKKFVRHYICKSCGLYLGESPETCCDICQGTQHNYFITFDILSAIKDVLKRNWKGVQEYAASKTGSLINDIMQGQIVRKLKGTTQIFISFNTDGVAVFNSNIKKSLWPIIITINNLPPSIRFARRNTIIAGLWLSSGDPDLDIFMKPFMMQLQKLACEGLQLFDNVKCIVSTICCCADSVARCKLQQIKQFNGYEGCSYCKHPGNLTESKQVRYGYMENVQLRNHKDTVKAMQLCLKRGAPVGGIKGISCLLAIPKFDLISYCPCDYMHAVLLGVCKQLCHLWFEGFGKDWYIKKEVEEIDKILTSIGYFYEASRSPRKISDRKSWKANEWQNWLLIYSSVCLHQRLPKRYYDHFQLLATCINTLLCDSLTEEVINKCETQITLFVKDFEILYGIDEMKYNVHLLTHIAACVRDYGPLWAFSLFNYEDMNGVLKKYVKGPKEPIIQIATRCALAHVKENVDFTYNTQEQVRKFCEDINKKQKCEAKCMNSNFIIPENVVNTVTAQIFEEKSCLKFNRYLFKRQKHPFDIVSHKCTTNDSMFTIVSEGCNVYGFIQNILFSDSKHYLLYKPIAIEQENESLLIGIETGHMTLIEVNDTLQKCIPIFANDKMFVRKIEFVPWID